MPRGAFITLEGGEGVGKSTCLSAVESALRSAGHQVVVTREPGGTPVGEQIRDWVLDGEHGPLSAEVEALMMLAARAIHVDAVIEPALRAGSWVVCDRYADATLAYQGGGRGADAALLRRLSQAVQGNAVPDLTLLLDAPVDVGLARISGRAHDHFEREGRRFFERVRRAYLDLANAEPVRIRVVDAAGAREDVERRVLEELESFRRSFEARHVG